MKRRSRIALGLLLCLGLLAPSSASAFEHSFLETFGSANEPSFTEPQGMAVDQSTGDLLVIDGGERVPGEGTLSRWNSDGTPDEFAALGTNVIEGLSFRFPEGGQVAVDDSGGPTDGDIYVTERGAEVIQIFNGDGSPAGQLSESSEGALGAACGVAVDPTGNVYVGDGSGHIHKFANPPVNGESVDFEFSGSCTLAVGAGASDGFIFPVRLSTGEVPKLDGTDGGEQYLVDPGPGTTTDTVDPASGHLYVASGSEVREYDASGASEATQLPSFASGAGQVTGIAVDKATGNVYVAHKGSPTIEAWGPALLFPEAITEAASVKGADVTLHGVVNAAGGPPATCVFQYVEIKAKGFAGATSVPCSPAGPFTGASGAAVSAQAKGLPEAAYRYRLLASSENGSKPGGTLFFNTFERIPGLPDGRSYEMVSPAQKVGEVFVREPLGGALPTCEECLPGISNQIMPMQAAPDGESVVYEGQPFTGGLAAGPNEYLAGRGASGWGTQSLSPLLSALGAQGYLAFSEDLSRGVLYQVQPALSPQAPTREGEAFANLYLREEDGALRPLIGEEPPNRGPGSPVPGGSSFLIRYAGANAGASFSPSFSHLLFEANDALTEEVEDAPAAPEVAPGVECAFLGANCNLYEWEEGELRLVNVLPGNEEAAESGAVIGSGRLLLNSTSQFFHAPVVDRAISEDGSRIFWSSEESGQLYVRMNGEETLEIPGPGSCKKSEPLQERACFLTASSDGSRVLLSDGQIFELDAEEEAYEVSADLTEGEGGLQGILGTSEDLSRVYFIDTKALSGEGEENENGEHAEEGELNLYAWEEGVATFVGILRANDNSVGFSGSYGAWKAARPNRTSQVSPDGRYLALMSEAPLTGADDGVFQVFEYDAVQGSLVCASCNPFGEEPVGGANLSVTRGENAFPPFPQPGNLSAAGGGRLFFESQDALSPQDTNGHIQDVYEWEPQGVGSCKRAAGCVYLISSGHSLDDSKFMDSTPSGSDAFFVTREQLALADKDEQLDLYDARVGGGIPAETETINPECLGEACQPAALVPNDPTPSSSAFNGAGNVSEKAKKKQQHKKKKKRKRQDKKRDRKRANANHGGAK